MIWDSINNSKNQIRTQTWILRVASNIASRNWWFSFCIVSDQSRFYCNILVNKLKILAKT